jgi:hypothetical protein
LPTSSLITDEGSSPEGPSPIATAAIRADADFGGGSLHEHVRARPARKPSIAMAAARRPNFCDECFLVLAELLMKYIKEPRKFTEKYFVYEPEISQMHKLMLADC